MPGQGVEAVALRLDRLVSESPLRRRQAQRRQLDLQGYARLGNGTTFSITLRDLSTDGCRIETPLALLPDLPLELCIGGAGEFHGKVRWSASGLAGLHFSRAEEESRIDNRRDGERLKIGLEVILRHGCGSAYPSKVSEISRGGCKIEFLKQPLPGDKVIVRFPGLDALQAGVRWCRGFDGGVEFLPAIHPAVFQVLTAHHLKALWLSEG